MENEDIENDEAAGLLNKKQEEEMQMSKEIAENAAQDGTCLSPGMLRSKSIGNILKGILEVQRAVKNVVKDKLYKGLPYASLQSVLEIIRNPLSDNGLVCIQYIHTISETTLSLSTIIYHTSGEWMEFTMDGLPTESYGDTTSKKDITLWSSLTEAQKASKNIVLPKGDGISNIQKVGSTTTYARRYSLNAIFMIGESDQPGDVSANQSTYQNPVDQYKTHGFTNRPAEASVLTSEEAPITLETLKALIALSSDPEKTTSAILRRCNSNGLQDFTLENLTQAQVEATVRSIERKSSEN